MFFITRIHGLLIFPHMYICVYVYIYTLITLPGAHDACVMHMYII